MSTATNTPFRFSLKVLAIPLYTVLFLWIVLWADNRFNLHFRNFGIFPLTPKGLIGIIFSPFIHGDIAHLAHNSLPLFIMLMTLLYFYKEIAFKVIWQGTLILGLITWLIARPAYHIGASGVIYLLVSFIFFSGVLSKNYRLIAVSLIVIFLYGSLVWYMFPIKEKMSWEGHLSGFIAGIILAVKYRSVLPQPEKYNWEKENYLEDEFDLLFDEKGNFNPPENKEDDTVE